MTAEHAAMLASINRRASNRGAAEKTLAAEGHKVGGGVIRTCEPLPLMEMVKQVLDETALIEAAAPYRFPKRLPGTTTSSATAAHDKVMVSKITGPALEYLDLALREYLQKLIEKAIVTSRTRTRGPDRNQDRVVSDVRKVLSDVSQRNRKTWKARQNAEKIAFQVANKERGRLEKHPRRYAGLLMKLDEYMADKEAKAETESSNSIIEQMVGRRKATSLEEERAALRVTLQDVAEWSEFSPRDQERYIELKTGGRLGEDDAAELQALDRRLTPVQGAVESRRISRGDLAFVLKRGGAPLPSAKSHVIGLLNERPW